ncbi:MAG TPA: GlsB/YeaQ/YmgE family stress response membrane protein [Novosphingobium sp.]|nr:GlsB/YeaQ/YmgE family stress response membrane protein [Novosphingobium sp.]
MPLIVWLLVGGFVGWLAGAVMKNDAGCIGNIVIGIAGAFIGGLIFGRGTINNAPLTISSLVVSVIGAIVLIGLVNLLRQSGGRRR